MRRNYSRSVVVTGGCGFIGANLVPFLETHGYRVKVLDNLSRGFSEYLAGTNAELITADIRDKKAVKKAATGVRNIIHLAAYGSVVESVSDPVPNFDINVHGTLQVLEAAKEAEAEKFIFASTGGALIGDASPPVDENSVPKPISPYGASKLCGEAYCNAYGESYGLKTVMLRFANVYGPYSAHKKGAVTAFIKALLREEPIQIYGDGSASRDFLHVDDLIGGIVAALEKNLEPATTVHLAAGRETSIKQLAEILRNIAGRPDHPIEYFSHRRGEVARNFAEYGRASTLLDFQPTIALEKGLEEIWNWFRVHQKSVLETETTDS